MFAARLAMLHNRRKVDTEDLNRPQLRKRPGSGTATSGDDKEAPPDAYDIEAAVGVGGGDRGKRDRRP